MLTYTPSSISLSFYSFYLFPNVYLYLILEGIINDLLLEVLNVSFVN